MTRMRVLSKMPIYGGDHPPDPMDNNACNTQSQEFIADDALWSTNPRLSEGRFIIFILLRFRLEYIASIRPSLSQTLISVDLVNGPSLILQITAVLALTTAN